jgi:transposase
MYSVGLDVHQRRSSLEILDPNGKRVNRLEVKGPWPKLVEQVERLPRPFSICFEASCGYGHLYEQLARHAEHVAVAHPAQLRLIFRSKRKNDRVDAAKLAKLLYLGEVPQVHVPDKDVRQWRASIEWRQALLGRRVRVKNQLRAMLRTHGLAASAPRSLWSKKGLGWLAGQPLEEFEQLRRSMLLDELAEVNRKLALVERHLAKVAAAHPGVALLRTIPGVGIRTAEAFVPCQDSSADVRRLGHITKDGPATVRKLLCEAAWQAVRRSPSLKARFERIAGGKPDRRKIALVAVAHHLCHAMAAMLRSGACWSERA